MNLSDKEIIDIRRLLSLPLYTQRQVDDFLKKQARELEAKLKPAAPPPPDPIPRWVDPYSAAWVGTAGSPLTSTSFDGDAFSTTAKTLINLNTSFGVPAGVRVVRVRIACRDSLSVATNNLFVLVSPNAIAGETPVIARPSGLLNDYYAEAAGDCPCDADGNIYYQVAASGADTMDVVIQIWGYCR